MTDNHLSASQMSTWLHCRMQWALSRSRPSGAETQAQQTGRLAHKVLELYHATPDSERSEAFLEECYHRAWEQGDYDPAVGSYARPLLKHFWARFGADPEHNPTQVEVELRVPFTERNDLVCVLDDLTVNDAAKTLVVGENKTSLKKIELMDKSYFQLQPHVYKLALASAYPGYTLLGAQFTLLWPTGAARVFRPLEPDTPLFDSWPLAIAHEMERGEIVPNLGHACSWCEYHDKCELMLMTGQSPLADPGENGWWREE